MTGPPPIPVDYLTLGGTWVPVRADGGGRIAPTFSGDVDVSFGNIAITSERANETKQAWQFTTPPVDATEWAVLRAIFEAMAFVDAVGMAIDRTGAAVLVLPRITTVTHSEQGDDEITYEITFRLDEV